MKQVDKSRAMEIEINRDVRYRITLPVCEGTSVGTVQIEIDEEALERLIDGLIDALNDGGEL